MNSTFFGINIGLRGLQAQQKGLEVSSHNIANANSPGYTRQRAVMQASTPFPVPALNRPVGPGQLGTGVEVAMIDRIRDAFLDGQIRSETASLGRWEELSKALEQAEIVFMEPGETGLATLLDQFWNSWQELSKYPESAPVRTTVVETANALAEALRHTYTQLTQIQDDINTSMDILVKQVNTLADQIAALNKQIVAVKLAGDQPNDLLDQRDLLLDELSGVVNIQVEEQADGSIKVMVAGQDLLGKLTGDPPQALVVVKPDTGDPYYVAWADDNPSGQIDWSALGGRFLGMYEARDVLVEGYLDDLDALAVALAGNVNTIHQGGLDLDGKAGKLFFVKDGTSDPPTPPTSSPTAPTSAGDIAVNPALIRDVNMIAAASGTPYDPPVPPPPGDGTNALEIAKLQHTPVDFDPAPETSMYNTIDNFYRNLVARLGVSANEANRMVENQGVLVDQLTNRKESLSGVSLDEEMANLVQFQRAYEAAARVITTMDSLLDTLINRMAV